MSSSALFKIVLEASWKGDEEQDAALADATVYLQSLSSSDTSTQLTYRGGWDRGVLHLLALCFPPYEQAASFLSLVIERGRESCGTTALISLADTEGNTPLHVFAAYCPNLSLTKMVLREYPPPLAALNIDGETPLNLAESNYGSTSERVIFFRAASAAFNANNFVAFEALCGGSSPYLSREIGKQAKALRAAVTICLNRQEEMPSALNSVQTGVALSLLERVRDFGRVGNSSDLLRRVLEYVGPYARPCDEN